VQAVCKSEIKSIYKCDLNQLMYQAERNDDAFPLIYSSQRVMSAVSEMLLFELIRCLAEFSTAQKKICIIAHTHTPPYKIQTFFFPS